MKDGPWRKLAGEEAEAIKDKVKAIAADDPAVSLSVLKPGIAVAVQDMPFLPGWQLARFTNAFGALHGSATWAAIGPDDVIMLGGKRAENRERLARMQSLPGFSITAESAPAWVAMQLDYAPPGGIRHHVIESAADLVWKMGASDAAKAALDGAATGIRLESGEGDGPFALSVTLVEADRLIRLPVTITSDGVVKTGEPETLMTDLAIVPQTG